MARSSGTVHALCTFADQKRTTPSFSVCLMHVVRLCTLPPLANTHPLQSPPPPPGRPSLPCFSSQHVLCWFVLPICFMHGLALLSHYFKSSTCVCSVIFSLQRRCMGVLCCYFRPKMFSPGDHVRYHSRTLGAHVLATVVSASVEGTTVCLEIPLQSPPPPLETVTWRPSPPPPPGRPSRANPGVCKGGQGTLLGGTG